MTRIRFSVSQLDATLMQQLQKGRPRPATVLVDVEDDDSKIVAHATAWAHARGYYKLTPALESMLTAAPPSGFAIILNRTHALLAFASWPWSSTPHIFDGQPSTTWPNDELPEL